MSNDERPLAVITGASSGIGYELAKCCGQHDFDLVVAADESEIHTAARRLRHLGVMVDAVEADLSTLRGVDELLAAIGERPVCALIANAGTGLGGAFLEQPFASIRHVIDTNITGTLYLLREVGAEMRERGEGHILITGSIAGFIPGTYHAVYNATKAFLDSFAFALRAELEDAGVSVTCLMPGATETEFFERSDTEETRLGESNKQEPDEVAEQGFAAMMRGDGDVVPGWQNKLRAALAKMSPPKVTAEIHRHLAEPGGAHR